MNSSANLDVNCPRCSVKITIDRNTTYCPRCAEDIGEDVVELYSKLDAIDNRTKPIKNIGKGVQSVGEEVQEWGCIIFMLPFAFLGILIILAMCSAY